MLRLTWIGLLTGLAPLVAGGCDGCDSSGEREVAEGAASSGEGATAGPRIRPEDYGVGVVLVNDQTPVAERPVDLSLEADTQVRAALLAPGRFRPLPQGDAAACTAVVDVYYALIHNQEALKDAVSGEARMGLEANLSCPRGQHVDAFSVELTEIEPFDNGAGRSGEAALRRQLAALVELSADALHGQVLVRHADDAAVLKELSSSDRLGVLLEASSEAGERKLVAAVGDLVRLTAHDSSALALRAGAALGLIGDARPEALSALARMTDGPELQRHMVAIHALSDIGGAEAARYLDSLAVGHPHEPLRDVAREAADRARRRTPQHPAP